MRTIAADHRPGWSSVSPKRSHSRAVWTLVLLTGLLGGLFVSTPPGSVSADPLSDALAKQKAVQAQIAKQKAQVAALTASQAALKDKLATTKASLDSVNANLEDVKTQVVAMTVQVAAAQAQLDQLNTTVALLDQQLADLEARAAEKQKELATRKTTLAERIRIAYDTDRTSLLETFLSGASFTDVLSEVSYHLDIGTQDKALAEEIVADQKVLAVMQQTAQETKDEAESMRQAAADQKAELDQQYRDLAAARDHLSRLEAQTAALLAQQQATFAKMSADKAALAKAIADGEKAEQQLASQISALIAAQRSRGIPSRYSGTFSWPMAGSVTQWFGCTGFPWEPPLGSCAHFHQGIDISAPMYTPIRAAAPGRVVFAGANPYDAYPKAWIVIVAHSNSLTTWYAHIDNYSHPPAVHAGDWVVTGQVIAYEGMTGHTTGPHLHWAVMLDGQFVNPRLFL